MEKDRKLPRRIFVVVIAVFVLWALVSLFGSSEATEQIRRPDVRLIQAVAKFKSLEMPPAVFLHDKHLEVVLHNGKDCAVCHGSHATQKSPLGDYTSAEEAQQAYHQLCIGCHNEMVGMKGELGPKEGECRLCHIQKSAVRAATHMRMNPTLHYLHISSPNIQYEGSVANPDGVNCGVCHHVYDESAKKLVWKPGAEDSCASCHGKEADGKKPSLQGAVHYVCVTCHARADNKDCTPCHMKPLEQKANASQNLSLASMTPEDMVLQPVAFVSHENSDLLLASTKLAPGQIADPFAQKEQKATSQETLLSPNSVGGVVAPKETAPVVEKSAPESAQTDQIPAQAKKPAVSENPVVATPDAPKHDVSAQATEMQNALDKLIKEKQDQAKARQAEATKEAQAIRDGFNAGPYRCAECHSAEGQAKLPKMNTLPRLMRGQPDAILLGKKDGKNPVNGKDGINPVFFDHERHEAVADSCRTCHHEKIAACTDCHTTEGKAEGQFVTLETAMHHACVECHQRYVMQKPDCAGCHVQRSKPMENPATCTACHQPITDLSAKLLQQPQSVQNKEKEMAKLLADMPETVRIDALSEKYDPCLLPHRKIYQALLKGMKGDGLANGFHSSVQATCAACHHHSPAATLATPPKCASCHALADKVETVKNRPTLKAAYHQQCMTCHESMKITKPVATDCTGCHAAK